MTTRVMIAPVSLADGEELVLRNTLNRDYHAPWSEPFTDRDGFSAFYAVMQTPDNCALVVRQKENDAAVGVVTFSRIARGNFQCAFCGYYGFRETAGRGLMREGLSLALTHAFSKLGLHRIEANIQPDNARSIALVRSLGFRREGFSPAYLKIAGEWRDHERWALLENEWQS